jgi:kumamolisin
VAPLQHVPLSGSERTPLPGARAVGPADPAERIQVTVLLHPRSDLAAQASPEEIGAQPPDARRPLSREEFAAARGAAPEALEAVAAFARAHGLEVVSSDAARRSVVLEGTVADLSTAFGVQLQTYEHPKGRYRGRAGAVFVPASLRPLIQAVVGLDDRPQARAHFRMATATPAATTSHSPPEIARLYGFPSDLDGQGQCIGIIELGGGYSAQDLATYAQGLGLTPPRVVTVSVDGASTAPTGDPSGPDGEVMLDIEVAGTIAPAATIAVYFAPNTDRGFIDALTTALHDTTNRPSVLSISWGESEDAWTSQTAHAMDQVFQDAATLGVTVCVASGDDGAADNGGDGRAHVDFPAADPYVLGCGGTRIETAGGRITSETVWNAGGGASGGGVSDVFPPPTWQGAAGVPGSANDGHTGRGVPDVAGNADPASGYRVRVDGQDATIGGTSAVAPLWAALIALVNQSLAGKGRPSIGYLNPLLYQRLAANGDLNDVVQGTNDVGGDSGGYRAGPGWDPCTGWGSPRGDRLLADLAP